ncbi:hypothetical protein KFK09_015424 [Dendrobium nobile]|uniref:Uncharacterized protein n=1 Tax=Dendrobium nobile TaxID=94219 RepID=A0A8T3B5Y7_DENNO|nr:hypothetical protein KFK09_015424 [Dendrobium nobile]
MLACCYQPTPTKHLEVKSPNSLFAAVTSMAVVSSHCLHPVGGKNPLPSLPPLVSTLQRPDLLLLARAISSAYTILRQEGSAACTR